MDIDLLLPLGIFMAILATPIVLFTSINFGSSKSQPGRERSRDQGPLPRSVKPQTHTP